MTDPPRDEAARSSGGSGGVPGPTVVARDLTCRFGTFTAVDSVSFEVSPGEIFGFLGSNGAGKTTTIRMLCGLLAPTSGTASVMGIDAARDPYALKHLIGYMSQKFSLYTDLSVEENLRFWGSTYGLFAGRSTDRIRWALDAADLSERRAALVQSLPVGYRQRLALVAALLHEPSVVFLDEPTGGVDPEARRRFWDLIDGLADSGTTVFVTTHYMDEAERCHRVALMHAGKILALDTVPALKRTLPPGTVVEVVCPQPARALAVLQSVDGVGEVALFGDRLRALLDDPGRSADAAARLEAAGFEPFEMRPIAPSLEDVFIRVIEGAAGADRP